MKPHPHADLMRQYAEDHAVDENAWKNWQFSSDQGKTWNAVSRDHPAWNVKLIYRRKPSTIDINGFQVPEPYRGKMEIGQSYWSPDIGRRNFVGGFKWADDDIDDQLASMGCIHLTKESAALHGKALASFTNPELKPE